MQYEQLIKSHPKNWRELVDWSYVFYYLKHRKNLNGPKLAKRHDVTPSCVMSWRNKKRPSKTGAFFLIQEMEITNIKPFLKERV